MRTYEIHDDEGTIYLMIGETKGGMTIIAPKSEIALSPDEARILAQDLIDLAESLKPGG